jgi:thymidylate kinase
MKGNLILIDGLDGSGKSTAMQTIRAIQEAKGKKVLDLREYAKEFLRIPEYRDVSNYDVYLSSEPTYCKFGRAIKEELINAKDSMRYSGISISQAFALDREMLYRKFIIPAIDDGKMVVQEHGVTTTMIYQPVQIHIPLTYLMELPGNKLAMRYCPNLIIIMNIEPENAAMRLNTKQEDIIFKELSFQRNIAYRYKSDWFKDMFMRQGSRILYLDVNPPKTQEQIAMELKQIFEGII